MLSGRTVLLVEDEYFIADDLAKALRSAGAKLIGPVATLESALEALDRDGCPDGAIVDIHLRGIKAYQLVDRLLDRGTPVLFVTGYDEETIPVRYRHLPRVIKPGAETRIIPMLAQMMGPASSSGTGAINDQRGKE